MDEPQSSASMTAAATSESCAQCGSSLASDDRVAAGDRLFCRSCHASLRAELEREVASMSTGIDYSRATIGALLGGVVGALAWWGFTVLTKIAFGLVAVVIGLLVAHGAMRFAGGKRSLGLQVLSVFVSLMSFVVATYLVNMTFVNRMFAERGDTFRLTFPPANLDVFARVLTADVGLMDAVFLAIVLYQAWQIPRPIALPPMGS